MVFQLTLLEIVFLVKSLGCLPGSRHVLGYLDYVKMGPTNMWPFWISSHSLRSSTFGSLVVKHQTFVRDYPILRPNKWRISINGDLKVILIKRRRKGQECTVTLYTSDFYGFLFCICFEVFFLYSASSGPNGIVSYHPQKVQPQKRFYGPRFSQNHTWFHPLHSHEIRLETGFH